jgi:hypothetical protein
MILFQTEKEWILFGIGVFALLAFFFAGYATGRGHHRLLRWQLKRAWARNDALQRMYEVAELALFKEMGEAEELREYVKSGRSSHLSEEVQ